MAEQEGKVPDPQSFRAAARSSSSGSLVAGSKSLLIFFVLALAWLVGFSSRLFSVLRFESIIHEFDPWSAEFGLHERVSPPVLLADCFFLSLFYLKGLTTVRLGSWLRTTFTISSTGSMIPLGTLWGASLVAR